MIDRTRQHSWCCVAFALLACSGWCSGALAQVVGSTPNAEPASENIGIIVRVSGGAGIGARTLEWPASGETLAVDTGVFAALDLGASFAVAFESSVSLGLEFSYETSVAAEVEETHIAGESDSLGIRAHRFDAVFAVAFGGSGFRVTPALGYSVRGLRPEVHHLLTPSYSLAGPIAKVGVRVPFAGGFALRAVPEAQFVVVGDDLEELGIARSGFGLGGEVALEIAVARTLTLELSGRAMRAWLASSAGSDASDTGEFATARLVWQP